MGSFRPGVWDLAANGVPEVCFIGDQRVVATGTYGYVRIRTVSVQIWLGDTPNYLGINIIATFWQKLCYICMILFDANIHVSAEYVENYHTHSVVDFYFDELQFGQAGGDVEDASFADVCDH